MIALTLSVALRYERGATDKVKAPEGDASGGAGRDRTGDPLVANQVLSQLSYSPGLRWGPLDAATAVVGAARGSHRYGSVLRVVGLSGFEPLTSRLSAVRSSQLSYRPVVGKTASRRGGPSALGHFWFLFLKSRTAAQGRPFGDSLKTR